MLDVICVGSATLDHFLTIHQKLKSVTYGNKILVKNLETHTGGGGSNSATALSKLGLAVGYLGKLGKDQNGILLEKEFKKNKIKLLNKNKSASPTDEAFIFNSDQERDRVIYVHKGSSENLLIKDLPKKLDTKWFYLATLTGSSFPILPYLSNYAKKNHIKLLFNPSTYLASQCVNKLKTILKNTDILILNKEESQLLLKTKRDDIFFLLKKIKEKTNGLVIITNGPKPVYAFDGKNIYSAHPPKIKVVHTAGCGDAFNAGFLFGGIKTHQTQAAIQLGLANAASVAQHLGTKTGLLTEKEAITFIKKYGIKVEKHQI